MKTTADQRKTLQEDLARVPRSYVNPRFALRLIDDIDELLADRNTCEECGCLITCKSPCVNCDLKGQR